MATLSASSKQLILGRLRRQRILLTAQLNFASAQARKTLRDDAHKTISNHEADVASTPNITLSRTIPSLQTRISLMEKTIRFVEANSEYGTCEDCGNEIPIGRLEMFPFATKCCSCQKQREDAQKQRGLSGRTNNMIFL